MSPYNYPKKTYIGRFDCSECGYQIEGVEFNVDTMEFYCKLCDSKKSLLLTNIKLKVINNE